MILNFTTCFSIMYHLSINVFPYFSVFKVTVFWHLVKVCQGQNVCVHWGPTVRKCHSWIEHVLMRTQPEDMSLASLFLSQSNVFTLWSKMKLCPQNSRNTVLISNHLIHFNVCCRNRWGNLFENSCIVIVFDTDIVLHFGAFFNNSHYFWHDL